MISPPGTPTASPALQRSFLPNGRRPTAPPYDINYGAASSVTIAAKPSPATPTVSNQPLRGPFYAQQNFAPDPLEGRTAAPAQKLGTPAKELALASLPELECPQAARTAWAKDRNGNFPNNR